MKGFRSREAGSLCERALKGREQDVGVSQVETIQTARYLANLYHSRGRYKVAAKPLERVLDPATLRTEHDLAIVYEAQGRYDDAVCVLKRAIDGKRRDCFKTTQTFFDQFTILRVHTPNRVASERQRS
jgi:hypothetical protein